jgi:8-oxo-dGTP pyrophosphatase MutT (NUDIX family)
VDFGDWFVIITDRTNGFWFLPEGGVEQNKPIEETAKREALEELGLETKINRVIKEFHVGSISKKTKEQLIASFYANSCHSVKRATQHRVRPNRKIFLVKKRSCRKPLHSFKIPVEYGCMSPYCCVSKEVVCQLAASAT